MTRNSVEQLDGGDNDDDESGSDGDFVPEENDARSESIKSKRKRDGQDVVDEANDKDESDPEDEGRVENDEVNHLKKEASEVTAQEDGSYGRGKRQRTTAGNQETRCSQDAASELSKERADDAWKQFKNAEAEDKAPSSDTMITIERSYTFAGEDVVEKKLVPESDPDAIAYLKEKRAVSQGHQTASASHGEAGTSAAAKPKFESSFKNPVKAGPKKRKGSSLAAMSAAATAKPTKLNTLEKSKMDWEQFKQSTASVGDTSLTEEEKLEMEQQTKGGSRGLGNMRGYLERKEFLDRVSQRNQ